MSEVTPHEVVCAVSESESENENETGIDEHKLDEEEPCECKMDASSKYRRF